MYYLYLLLFYLFVFLLLFVLFSHIYRVFVYCALFCFPLVCFRPDLVCLFFHKYTCSIIYNYYDFPPAYLLVSPLFLGVPRSRFQSRYRASWPGTCFILRYYFNVCYVDLIIYCMSVLYYLL